MTALTRDQVRSVDRIAIEQFDVPGIALMENAGRNAAELLLNLGIAGRVVICCGKGNNGGDGFVIARHLDNAGHAVQVLLSHPPEELAGDAAINFRVINKSGIAIETDPQRFAARLADADWIVDALLGTGLSSEVREPFASLIEQINSAGKRVFAVDMPSGLDCDTGEPLGVAIRAQHTATFVARKVGFDNPASSDCTGEVHVIDIGVPRAVITSLRESADSAT